MDPTLFEPADRFRGLPVEGFDVFALPDRARRRHAIVETFHPPLEVLADDLIWHLQRRAERPLKHHLPRLDWPRDYEPFCTWLALSHQVHGYQNHGQLNVGVHAGYVAIRLGWDATQDAFGRFEFLARCGGLGEEMARLAVEHGLRFRVYASARWPEGSRCVFESATDWQGAFETLRARGLWFELGVRHDLPRAAGLIGSPALGREAARVFGALLPVYERVY